MYYSIYIYYLNYLESTKKFLHLGTPTYTDKKNQWTSGSALDLY